jgi:PAS domain S-box-containing protein
LLLASGLLYYITYEERNQHVDNIKQEVLYTTELISGMISQSVEGSRQLLTALIHSPFVINRDADICTRLFAKIKKHNPQLANLVATDTAGNVFCSAQLFTKRINLSDIEWFQQTMQNRSFTISDYQRGLMTDRDLIVFGNVAADDAGKVRAAVFVPIDIAWVSRQFEKAKMPYGSAVTLLDRNGTILARYPDHEKWIGKTITESKNDIYRIILTKHEGIGEARDVDGITRIYAFAPVPDTYNGIYVNVGISKEIILGDINARFGRNLIFIGIFGIISAFAAFYIGKIAEKSEKKLRASEEKFRMLVENIPQKIFIKDRHSVYISCNDNYARDLKIAPDEIAGRTDYEFYPKELAEKYRMDDKAVIDAGIIKDMEEEYIQDGEKRFVHTVKTPIKDKEGKVAAVMGIFWDITEHKKAEEALQKSESFIKSILESVGEGFVVIDSDFRIISANKAYCQQVKTPSCDIIGRHCYEVSHHIDRPCFRDGEECAPQHTFKTGAPHFTIHTHYDKDRSPVYIETRSFPMKDASGNLYAVIQTISNITEKRNLEDQLRHIQKMEAIGTLAGGIAHDFNNLLNVILGYGGLMQMRIKPDDPLAQQLKEILAAGERATHLTKGLLTFSRKQVMEVKVVNLNEIIDGFKKMLARIIGEDIELRISKADEDLIIKADIVQIEQVLMNLAANARDAMQKGGILAIHTEAVQIDKEFIKAHGYGEPYKYALITVSDTGTGMDEKTCGRIFEPYFTTKELGRGTGLGLSIVYGIVKQHNGYINCYSEYGRGTTFRIYLPLVKETAEGIEAAETALPAGGDETILLAEDDPNVRKFLKDVLEGFGYIVIEAVDGEEAVKRFREYKDAIKLLLFDIIMPKKNGKDAYEDIKGIRHDIKALFLSGYARDIIQKFGIENGIEFISKPVSSVELLRKVREVLDK